MQTPKDCYWIVLSKTDNFVKGYFSSRKKAREYRVAYQLKNIDSKRELYIALVRVHERNKLGRVLAYGLYKGYELVKITHSELKAKLFKNEYLVPLDERRTRQVKRVYLEILPNRA